MAAEAPKEGLDISALQMELLTIALGETDPSIGERVFPIVHRMKGEGDVLDILGQLKGILPAEKLDPVISRVETALIGTEFQTSAIKKSLALRVVRFPKKAKALEWLRNIDEAEINASISVIVAAIEVEISEVFEDEQIEGLTLRPRSERYRELSRSLVELHAKYHDIKTRNFMIVLNGLEMEAAVSAISFGLLKRIRQALGEEAEESREERVDMAAGEPDAGKGSGGSGAKGRGNGKEAGGTAADGAGDGKGSGGAADGEGDKKTDGATPGKGGGKDAGGTAADADDRDGDAEKDASPKSFIAFVMTSSTKDAVSYYQGLEETQQREAQTEILRQIELAKQTNNALVFVYFYTLARAVSIADRITIAEADLRAMYVNLIVKKSDPRPLGRFLNCVLAECHEITGIKERPALEAKWKLKEDEYPKPLNADEQRRLMTASGYLGGVKASKDAFNFGEALKHCENPSNLLLAAIMDFIVNPSHDTQVLDEVLKGIRTSRMGIDTACGLINFAFDKAVQVFVHTNSITSVGILALRKLCEEKDGNEAFERLGRSFVKYLSGRYKHADKAHVEVLEEMEKECGHQFVGVNAFYKPDQMKQAVEGLFYHAVASLGEVTGPNPQTVLSQKRSVGLRYAKLFADFRECLGYKGRVRNEFFMVCRAELSEYGQSQDAREKSASLGLSESLGVAIFPDFVCEPSNRKLFKLVGGQGSKLPLRNLLEGIISEDAKLSFIALVKGDPVKAFNHIVDTASANGGDVLIIKDVMAILLREGILDIGDLKTGLSRSIIQKPDSDWGALRPDEQRPVLQLIEELSLNS